MALNKNRVFSKVLFSLGWLIFAVHAHSGTICVGPCPQPPPTIVEDRQYQYSGYLSDLTVSSSQQLPVSLTQFYNLLGVNTGAAVPVSLSFTVERVSGQYMTSFGYHYLASFGSVSVSGSMNYPVTSSAGNYSSSPFSDNVNTYPAGVADQVNIHSSSYAFSPTSPFLAIQSRNADALSGVQVGGDHFYLSLNDSTASAINNSFPDANNALETLFQNGIFSLAGSIQFKDENGIIIPFDNTNELYLNGTLSSAPVTLNPSRTDIGFACNYGVGVCFSTTPPSSVPLPSGSILFLSALMGLANIRVGRRS